MTSPGRKLKDPTGQAAVNASEFAGAATVAGLSVFQGKTAVKTQYQPGISSKAGLRFTASVDVDKDCEASEPLASRWDYGLGLQNKEGSEFAVWIEPHPASSSGEVAKIIAKLDWLERKLTQPTFKGLKALTEKTARADMLRFHWLAMTGAIRIRPGSREAALLSKRGLRLPCRHLVLS